MLVERATGMPCAVPLRWVVLERRERVAASTLADDLRAVQKLYEWSGRALDVPCDAHLIRGTSFSKEQIYDLALFVKTSGKPEIAGSIGTNAVGLNPAVFNIPSMSRRLRNSSLSAARASTKTPTTLSTTRPT